MTQSEVDAEPESVGTVVVAGLANLAIAAAKAVAGLLSGSAAMLSEAGHSVADTTTEVLLFVALRRGGRPADARRPFGYGQESFFWAFLAAVFTFVGGAGFAITHGVHTIRHGTESGDYLVSYVVLAISFVIESISLAKALRQVRSAAGRWRTGALRYLRLTPDTAVKAVTLEDVAALAGLVLAAAGLVASELTGSPVWDGISSVAIGVLLLAVAGILAKANLSLLLGQSVPPGMREVVRAELASVAGIDRVGELFTLVLGPSEVLVAAKVDFADELSGARIEAASDEADRRLRDRLPATWYVFLDPTEGAGRRT